MSTWNILTYAVSGLDYTATDITRTFANYILSKFPHGTFKKGSVYVDTMSTINDYKRREQGLEAVKKVSKPIMVVTIDDGLTDHWSRDDNGPDVKQYSMFPGTTTDRRLVNNHRLGMIYDKRNGIIVDTVEIRRKLELDFKIALNTKGDLETMKSYIYNTIPVRKNTYLHDMKTNIILPNSFVNDISKLAFKRGDIELSNPDHVDILVDYMNNHGFHNFSKKLLDTDDSEIWILMDRLFRMNYFILDMDSKTGTDANKDGEAYTNFTFYMRCTLDFKLPNSYIMNYKIFNASNKAIISNEYFNNVKLDNQANMPATFTNSVYIEDREYIKPVDNGFELVTREEFFIENPTETIRLSDFFPSGTIYRLILERATVIERNGIFDIQVYENDTIIEDSSISIEDIGSDILFTIKDCDVDVAFALFIYCDIKRLNKLMPTLLERVRKSIFPNKDENGNPLIVGSTPPTGIDPDLIPFDVWSADIEYSENKYIFHEYIVYKALQDNINIVPGSDSTIWKKVVKYWTPEMDFYEDEYVIYKSILFVVLIDNTGKVPVEDYSYFKFKMLLGGISGNFNIIDVSEEESIGGKNLHGGGSLGYTGNSGSSLQSSYANILAVRDIKIL